jgi:hypothetical protein
LCQAQAQGAGYDRQYHDHDTVEEVLGHVRAAVRGQSTPTGEWVYQRLYVFGLRQNLPSSKIIYDEYAEFLSRATAIKQLRGTARMKVRFDRGEEKLPAIERLKAGAARMLNYDLDQFVPR